MVVTMKTSVFWDVTLCGSCKKLVVTTVLATAKVPSLPILFTVIMMEVIRASETLISTRATWHHTPEDGILQL
jgi:hypothetical protein